MGQNRYSLSDGEMVEITSNIDNSQNGTEIIHYGIIGTWNAILAQEGMSFADFHPGNPLSPQDWAIPSDQAEEIMDRMRKRGLVLGISEIGVTNILMDWVNVGPSSY